MVNVFGGDIDQEIFANSCRKFKKFHKRINKLPLIFQTFSSFIHEDVQSNSHRTHAHLTLVEIKETLPWWPLALWLTQQKSRFGPMKSFWTQWSNFQRSNLSWKKRKSGRKCDTGSWGERAHDWNVFQNLFMLPIKLLNHPSTTVHLGFHPLSKGFHPHFRVLGITFFYPHIFCKLQIIIYFSIRINKCEFWFCNYLSECSWTFMNVHEQWMWALFRKHGKNVTTMEWLPQIQTILLGKTK